MPTINEVDERITTHEEVCAERYKGIYDRLGRLETILISVAGFIIVLLLGLVLK
jgi:hypothetical protein